METIIPGLVLIVLGVCMFLWRMMEKRKVDKIMATPTSPAKDLEKWVSIKGNLPGRSDRIVEIKGRISCEKPLTSEFTKKSCVFFHSQEIAEVREVYHKRNSKGREEKHTRIRHDTISNNKQMVGFTIEDATGKVLIQPEGAEIEALKVQDKYQKQYSERASGIFGLFDTDNSPRVLGSRFTEYVIPLGQSIYILGELATSSGKPCVRKPSAGEQNFIISVKTEEQILGELSWKLNGLLIAGITLLISGAFFLKLGFGTG